MVELVDYIAKSLSEFPEQVQVREINQGQSVIIELQVAREDKGRIIGKQGRIANHIRNLVKVAAAREGKRVTLEIV
ncbi:MAG: KH domain-containing protein [Chloroflexota bacterium]